MASHAYRNYVLGALTGVYAIHVVDRGLMILLLEPIKQDLRLSDTQLGFLTGIAFALFYATMGIPIARWADRGDRVTITSLALGVWGVTVACCLFVTNFPQMLAARIAAALGEAGCKPPTYALVGDYFPEPASRVRAMGIYMSGGLISNLISFIIGGWIAQNYGWRAAFFAMGLPAIAMAILFKLTIAEPRATKRGREIAASRTPLTATLSMLFRPGALRHLVMGLVLLYSMGFGLAPWYAAFLMRTHGMSTAELGLSLGLIFSLSGIVGSLAGGYAASRWFARDEKAQMRMSALTVAAVVPCFVLFLMTPSRLVALSALVPLVMFISVFLGPTYTLLQRLVTEDTRATSMAVIMLLVNLIGMGVGPQIVGILSDAFEPRFGSGSLRYAMLLMSFVSFLAAYHFWKASRTVRQELELAIGPAHAQLS